MMLQTGFAITMAEAFLPFTGTVFLTVLQHVQTTVRPDFLFCFTKRKPGYPANDNLSICTNHQNVPAKML